MLTVAIVGLLLGGAVCGAGMMRRRNHFLHRAHLHAWLEKLTGCFEHPPLIVVCGTRLFASRAELSTLDRLYRKLHGMAAGRNVATTLTRYHKELKLKYLDAASHPWILDIDSGR
jgi:hypothetical protein